MTHSPLSVIEQNGKISSLKRVYTARNDIRLCLIFTREEIAAAVCRLADEISRDYAGQDLLLIVVLKGAFIFAADLVRCLSLPHQIDFISLSSYSGMESSGRVTITKDIESLIEGRNVLVVEDIIDTGITLDFLLRYIAGKSPKSLKVCTLVDKEERRRVDIAADYTGIVCNRGFLVGYGLDMDGYCRELDAIYEVADVSPRGGLNDN